MDKKLESRHDNILLFSVKWFEAPEYITHVQGEGEVKQAVELLVWARVEVEEDGIWTIWNCWNIWNY